MRTEFLNDKGINIEDLTIEAITALPPEFRVLFQIGETKIGWVLFQIGETKIGSGCPSGYANKCKRDNGEAYYYDDNYANLSCDEI